MVVALGIDPGLRATGYSVIQGAPQGCRLLDAGIVRPTLAALPAQLREIYTDLRAILRRFPADVVAVEDLFAHPAFPRTALIMAHVRGVICLAAAEAGLTVDTLPPAAVKQVLTGSGRAPKSQVQTAVARYLGVGGLPDAHAADAAALALAALSRRGIPLRAVAGAVAAEVAR